MARTEAVRQQLTINIGIQCRDPQQSFTSAYSTFAEIKWIIYTLTAIGLLPFYTIVNDFEIGPTYRKRLITALYTTAVRTLCILLAIGSTYLLFSPICGYSFHIFGGVDNVNIALHIMLSILCFVTITLGCAWKSHDFQKIVNKLLLIDQQLQACTSIETPIQNNCAFYRRYLVLLCIFIALMFQIIYFSKNIPTSSLLTLAFYLIENTISNCFVIFIAVICHLLTMRFRYLNEFAKSFAIKEKTQVRCSSKSLDPTVFYVILTEERQHSELAENPFVSASSFIYRTHYDLLRIYKQLNNYVGPALLVYFVYIFYKASALIYIMASIAKEMPRVKFIIWHIASLYLHISIITLVSRCCSALTKEVGYVHKKKIVFCKSNKKIVFIRNLQAHQMSAILSSIYGRNEKCRKVVSIEFE